MSKYFIKSLTKQNLPRIKSKLKAEDYRYLAKLWNISS